MTLHANSLTAYRQEHRNLHRREVEILVFMHFYTGSCTDRVIAELMGFPHRSFVQPRISTLIADGYLYENGKTPCHVTGKSVRTVRISQKGKDWVCGTLPTASSFHIEPSGQTSFL
jgi:predicted transcriptional regulator